MPGWLMLGSAHPSDSRLKPDRNYVQGRIMRSPDRRKHLQLSGGPPSTSHNRFFLAGCSRTKGLRLWESTAPACCASAELAEAAARNIRVDEIAVQGLPDREPDQAMLPYAPKLFDG